MREAFNMKTKTKFFTILLVLTSCALSACGNPFLPSKTQKSSSKPEETSLNSSRQENTSSPSSKTPWTASSSSSSSYNPSHQHSYGEWQRVIEPTCTEEGLEERTCYICGIKTSRALPALGHEWSEWYVGEESSCTNGGYEEHKCVRCGEVEKRDIEPAHLWNNEQYISPIGEGYVGYDLTQCARGDAIKVDMKTIDGTFAEGSSNKVGSLEGFIKLSGNNQSISWVFNLATSYSYYGILYQRGMMDSWPNTNSGSYARTSSGYDYENGNFQVTVNGNVVDKTPYINIPYAEMFAEGEDSSYLGSNYSPIALVPIGYVSFQSGVNEIVYKRLNSYNPVISDLVFIGEQVEHQHTASSEWYSDENQHWHTCTGNNCPIANLKLDLSNHIFGNGIAIVAPTETEPGVGEKQCTVCGKTIRYEIPATGHEWGNSQIVVPDQEGYVYYEQATCPYDNAIQIKINAIDGIVDGSIKYGANETFIRLANNNDSITWKFNYAGPKPLMGKLYQIGYIDSFTSNKARTYSSISWGSSTDEGNFSVSINNNVVDKSAMLNVTYEELTKYGEDSSIYGSNLSPIAMCEIGPTYLASGYNEITYKRISSYCLYFSTLVFIGEEYNHVHNVSPDWLADPDYHWHGCSEPNCPGLKYDIASHDFGEWTVEIEPTCTEMGRRSHTCIICGQTVYEDIAANGHNYGDWTITSEATCTNSGRQEHTCLVCGSTSSEEISMTAHNYGEWFVDPENENNRYRICASCGHVDTREFPSGNYYLWLEEDLMSVFENPGTVKEVDYADGSRCFKSNIFNQGGNITLRFDSAYARTLRLKMYISVKIANVLKTGFWMQSNAEKMKITLNGERIVPPEVDLDFDALGCNIKDDIAIDSGNLSIPVWVDICDLNLVAGENQLMFEMNTSAGYSFYIGGCGLFGI